MKSLRARLALLSTCISGVIIVSFGVSGWFLTEKLLLEAVDLRLAVPLDRMVRDLHPRTDWAGVVQNAEISYGQDVEEGKVLLLLQDDNRDVVVHKAPEGEWLSEVDTEIWERREPPRSGSPPLESAPPPHPQPPPFDPLGLGGDHFGHDKRGKGPGPGPRPGGPPQPQPQPQPGGGPGGRLGGLGPPEFGGKPPPVEYHTVAQEGKNWRLGVLRDRGYMALMALDLSEHEAETSKVRRLLFLATPVCLLLIGIGGWFIANRALRPVATITETASHITARGLDQRIPSDPGDYQEFGELVAVLNGMMDRLEKSFNHAVRFSADVSHELKTPLAIMQGELSHALKNCTPGSNEETMLRDVSQECQRLKAITKGLMFLSQADAGRVEANWETIDLSGEAAALSEDAEILCERARLTFEAEIASGIEVRTDRVLLRQALENLVSNAIKYNEPGGWVRMRMGQEKRKGETGVVFSIANSGSGIPEEDREQVFERFYRVDKARGREVDGFGLGLNLAHEIIEVIGGELILAEADSESTRFEIWLPVADR